MRLVDADAVKKTIDKEIFRHDTIDHVFQIIDDAPTIDAVEVVRGEWIDKPTKGVRYICSRCRGRFDYQWKYCPNCGAKMSKESE